MQADRLGSALRRLRLLRELRQVDLATTAGVTKAMVSAYETGKRFPSIPTLSRLLGALDASLCDLHRAMQPPRRSSR